MDFSGKNILITGGSRGIGRACAQAFAKEGGNVIINFHQNEEAANSCLASLETGDHTAFRADISREVEVREMARSILKRYRTIDVLVNNAGIYEEHPIEKVEFEEWISLWKRTIDTNLMGLANLTYFIARQMIRQGYGHIVNISSRGAFRGEPDSPAYGASKSAVNNFSQSMAEKLGKYNISVTAVAPGFVETDMGMSVLEERGEEIRSQSPFGRVAKPEEVADTVLFLAGEKATFLSGGIIDINGASYLRK